METTMTTYNCQRPIHPGELLKEEIEYRGLKQIDLAAQIGVSYKVLNEVLNCRRPLSFTMAMLIEAATGIDAGLLMRMQLDYDMQISRQDKDFAGRLANIRKNVIPARVMAR